MIKRIVDGILIAIGVALAAVLLLMAFTPQGRAAARTTLFVPQVLPSLPVEVQPWFTLDPVVSEVRFQTESGEAVADLYAPRGDARNGAVLFFQGVVPGGRFDSRIVALADALARSGMVVMIPWLETQVREELVPEDIDRLVRGFQYLRSLDNVDPDRVGVGGICVGASFVTVAAQDDRIRDEVKFVNLLAGYYDITDLTRAIGSRSRFGDGYSAPWAPDSLTYEIFRYHLITGVSNVEDRQILAQVPRSGEAEEGTVEALSEEGKAVYRLLRGTTLEEADGLIEQLSPQTKELFRRVSPSTNIDKLSARTLIMHDRADALVPSEESRRMADALYERGDVYHTEFSLFQKEIQLHVGEAENLGLLDFASEAFKLYMHMYNILREAS